MENKNVIAGKGNLVELESLHGAITKAYVNCVIAILDDIETSDLAQREYEISLEETDEPEELPKPSRYVMGKDELALLKQAQGFLKENDVQCDIVGKTGSRVVRGKVFEQLKRKREEIEE